VNIIETLEDKALLGQFIADPATWRAWFAFLRSFFGLPPAEGDLGIYTACTGRTAWPTAPTRESWVVAGRRSGKSFITALIGTYLAVFREYRLSAGETGYVVIVAPTKEQAALVKRYITGFFSANDFLRPLLAQETATEARLSNRITILVLSADFRSIRGFTAVAGIVDEVAFLMDEGSRPDFEIIRALRPALMTTGGPLIAISSPYAKRGALYDAWKAHFGRDGDAVLVWQAPSALMNPTLEAEAIERAREEDAEAASSEWDAQFRSDIENFISREAVEGCIVPYRLELPPACDVEYSAFVDPSGGSGDSFTLAIAHMELGQRVLDVLRERRPPFSPDGVVQEYATLLKAYGCQTVQGDRYGGEWPRERFAAYGIAYEPAGKSKSELYLELLPLVNSGKAKLLDDDRLLAQLCRLERRTARSGKDSIDHPPNAHDDVANAAAGALVLSRPASRQTASMQTHAETWFDPMNWDRREDDAEIS
jgi:hypothetical protein